jgi:hypothetical protein
VKLSTKREQPQTKKTLQKQIAAIPHPAKGCDEDTYGNCVKVRATPAPHPPSQSPTCSMPSSLGVEQPIRYGNFYSPLCMEPSPLDAYVCPLFELSCQQDHTSQLEPTHCSKSSPNQENARSPKAKKPVWSQNQSAMRRSAALGVGLKKKEKYKAHFPCMDAYAIVTPTSSAKTGTVIQINHIQFNPNTNMLENLVQPIVEDSPTVGEPRIKLQLACEGDSVYVNLHLYEGLGHRLIQADGTNTLLPPKGPFCQKNGKVRKSYRLPHFTDRHNWSIRDTYLEDIFEKAQEYDSANGHIFPDIDQWVDAFAAS